MESLCTYKGNLRGVVAASAGPYGYTLTLWTAGAVTSAAASPPGPVDPCFLVVGAVTAFGIVGAFASGTKNPALSPLGPNAPLAGYLHLPAVLASILLANILCKLVSGPSIWLAVGFAATTTYLLVGALQIDLAARGRRRHAAASECLE